MMKLKQLILCCLILVSFSCFSIGNEADKSSPPSSSTNSPTEKKAKNVYVIPVRDDIDKSIIYVIRRGVKEAIENKADAIILHIDTYGGRVDITQEITEILRKFEPQSQTYTFIDTKAISAGAFISSATRNIYMAPGSVIGAAAPILSVGEGVEKMPKSYDEKIKSALRALVRANAELHDHNAEVFEAMIDIDQGFKIGNKEIVPEGKILTLTSKEASQTYGTPPKPLLSLGTIDSLDLLIEKIGGSPTTTTKIEPSGFEQLARIIVYITPFLLPAMLIFGYVEFKTPGFGVFGMLSICCAILFFFGHFVAGLSGHENLVIFALGILLIVTEIFILPGTIIPGALGLMMVLGSLLVAMIDYYPKDSVLPTFTQLQTPLMNLSITFVVSVFGIILLARILPESRMMRGLILDNVVGDDPTSIENSGSLRVGMKGIADSSLRPSGIALFDDQPVDVVADGTFIEVGKEVTILEIHGNQVTVKET